MTGWVLQPHRWSCQNPSDYQGQQGSREGQVSPQGNSSSKSKAKSLYATWFHLYEILEKVKLWWQKVDQQLPGAVVGAEVQRNMREISEMIEMFYILIVVVVRWYVKARWIVPLKLHCNTYLIKKTNKQWKTPSLKMGGRAKGAN